MEHWSARERECAVWRDSSGRLPLEVSGGAETGHFIWVCPDRSGAHRDILLEVEGLSVSGLPLYDVLNVLKNCEDPVRIKTVKAGGRLKKDLSYFLSQRFQKISADQRLQDSIRKNLYRHSAPLLRKVQWTDVCNVQHLFIVCSVFDQSADVWL
ncbi:hypothetical protein QQF64_031413, partial [Cirrhinus molitorella]